MNFDIEQIILENTKHIKIKEDRKHSEKWIRAYYTISKKTGIPLKDTVNYSYCFVKKGEFFGKIGVYEKSEYPVHYFKFKGKKEPVGFSNEKDIFWAKNVVMLLEEREKLFRLF